MPFDSTTYKPEVALEPWRKVLMDAADYIEAHGWCQEHPETDAGQVCLMVAIARSQGYASGPFCSNAPDQVRLAAWKMKIARREAAWNDAPGRTASEVIDALRQCAAS